MENSITQDRVEKKLHYIEYDGAQEILHAELARRIFYSTAALFVQLVAQVS